MGMMLNGRWQSADKSIKNGEFNRPDNAIRTDHEAVWIKRLQRDSGRFWLIASHSCPWSHRTTLMRQLKGLVEWIPLHYAFGPRLEGYALNGGDEWRIPGSAKSGRQLHELYRLHNTQFTGQVTVPLLWDSQSSTIISNESSDILRAFDSINGRTEVDFTLRPASLLEQIEAANDWLYQDLNNAVYRAGFATKQSAYERAVETVFNTLDSLNEHLLSSRYFFGNLLTETDLRLFPTLIRFDAIYHVLFKCCRRRLTDYPALFAYTRDLLQLDGIATTVDFARMSHASYLHDSNSTHPLIAVLPDIDWQAPHHRAELGPTQIQLKAGKLHDWSSPPTL